MGSRNNRLSLLLMFILTVATAAVFLRDQSASQLLAALRGAQLLYLLPGLALMVCFVFFEAACSKLTLRALGTRAPYRHCIGYAFTGFYFSAITPGASGGQPAQVYYMTRRGIPGAHGTLTMLMITICYQIAALLYALAAWIIAPAIAAQLGGFFRLLLIGGFVVMIALTLIMLLFLFFPALAARLGAFGIALAARVRIIKNADTAHARLTRQMEEYRRGAQLLGAKPALLPVLLALTLLQITCLYLVPFTTSLALGLTGVSPFRIVATQALITLAVEWLPLPGAVGANEAFFVRLYATMFGVGLVTPAVLLSRGVSLYAFLLISAIITIAVHMHLRKRSSSCG